MSSFFFSGWFVSLAVGVTVFFVTYLNIDRIIAFLQKRTIGTRDEVLASLKKMMMDVDAKRMSLLLNLCSYGLGALMFLVVWPNVVAGLILGFGAFLVGSIFPKIIVNNMWEGRCNRLVDQMVDGLTIMGNSIKAGQSITQALERVTENMRGPLAQEFGLVQNKVRLGLSLEDALNEFGDRIPRQDVQMFVTAVTVLKETGGNLAETFATIVLTIRDRQKIEKKIQALTAQGSMQATIITFVPFVLIGIFFALDPNYVMPLFTKPLGWFFLVLMITLQTIGLVFMKKIVTIKV